MHFPCFWQVAAKMKNFFKKLLITLPNALTPAYTFYPSAQKINLKRTNKDKNGHCGSSMYYICSTE